MSYTVSGRGDKQKVKFTCGACRSELVAPLAEAGQGFDCPTCGQGVIVPGIPELERYRAAEKEAADQAAEVERRRQEREQQRKQQADEQERQKAQRRAEIEAAPRPRSPRPARSLAAAAASSAAVTLALTYLLWIRPLQEQARESAEAWRTVSKAVEANGIADASHRSEYGLAAARIAAAIEKNAEAMREIEKTVTHNAAVASDNAKKANNNIANLSADLDRVSRLAENANRHAHSHDRW